MTEFIYLLVSRRGIEPLWALAHWILNPARLPVPPPRHMLLRPNILACNAVDFISKFDLWQEDIYLGVVDQRYCHGVTRQGKCHPFILKAKGLNVLYRYSYLS